MGLKGYYLWLRRELGFKVTTSKDVVFNETALLRLNIPSETIPLPTTILVDPIVRYRPSKFGSSTQLKNLTNNGDMHVNEQETIIILELIKMSKWLKMRILFFMELVLPHQPPFLFKQVLHELGTLSYHAI